MWGSRLVSGSNPASATSLLGGHQQFTLPLCASGPSSLNGTVRALPPRVVLRMTEEMRVKLLSAKPALGSAGGYC